MLKGCDESMKHFKRVSAIFMVISLLAISVYTPKILARNIYKWTNVKQIQVTAQVLNVRTGPSTAFPVIAHVYQNQVIDVMGTLGSWFVVHLKNNSVGCLSSKWTRVYAYHNSPTKQTTPKTNTQTPTTPSTPKPDESVKTSDLTTQEKEMFDLVNNERRKNGLPEYKVDVEVTKIARIKAKDMSDNNYFSHSSPTYGSPFDMLKQFGVSYIYAGENIAGNSTITGAHNSLMNSSGHRANILSSKYDAIGIGIVPDKRYGYVFVQMFIKR